MKNNFPHRVHFVGIGGIGMSGLAKHLVNVGCEVSGSDKNENEQTQRLRQAGVVVTVPHNAKCVKGAQLVVRTSAVLPTNEEVAFALSQGIPVVLREQLLGQIFDGFSTRIAVCGTHGKTTVTAMIHHVLERCGISHTAFIGGEYQHSNYFFGENVVVAEACEYNRSFLHLHPTLCLCL
ncbi:MAG: Mur ligase domain-containing protein, partial [Candidatus Fimimonas sp.]